MCEVPARNWQHTLRSGRVALAVVAAVCIVAAPVVGVHRGHSGVVGVGLLAIGVTIGIGAVVFPFVREVEFGFPVGVRVRAGVREHELELRRAFEAQKGDVELCAHLLCGPPEAAARLVEAAWARTVVDWRGSVTPGLRTYVLCVLVQLVSAHLRWVDGQSGQVDTATGPMASLPHRQRVAVVMHEFAGLPVAQIASMTERSVEELRADIAAAENVMARAGRLQEEER